MGTMDPRLRFLTVVITVLLAIGGSQAANPPRVFAVSCGSSDLAFAANEETHVDAVRGAKVAIEYFDPALCTGSASAFSSYWVGVVGPTGQRNNILQVGVDKCRGGACTNGAPANQTYRFWAYGHDAGACGAELGPEAHPIGSISSGTLTYKVIRESVHGQAYYNLYISTTGVLLWTFAESALETCWGSVNAAQYANEAGNAGDQIGGESGNTQTFSSVYWHDGSSWHQVTGTTGAWCDYHTESWVGCKWHSSNSTLWNSWDTRY